MNNLRSSVFGRALLLVLATWPALSPAAPLPTLSPPAAPSIPGDKAIPSVLLPWTAWATWGDEHLLCPTPYADANKHLCFWPSRLNLQAARDGGKFDLTVTVYHETWVPLPGNADVWPQEVKANGATIPVVQHGSGPAVQLPAGVVRLAGAYHWSEIPQSITIPQEIGILALVLDGQPVEAPVWDAQGSLWLKRDGSTEEADKNFLAVKLYAALEDGIPLWLRTEIELTVSGQSREEDLGTILPAGWKLSSVESAIPVAIDETGRMKAQVRAGKWALHADAFRFDNPKEFRYAEGAKVAASEELVAFRAQPNFRTVEITGVPSIDVSQTTLPAKWRELPVFQWDTATPFHFEERLRGMGEQKPAGLTIARELWLDENGRGLTFRDRLTGQMQQMWRLDAAEGQDLGSVRSSGQGQLITRNPQNAASGVEIRTRNLNLEATGRMARTPELSATGWRSDAEALRITLNLPPGWRLFALFGADWVQGDWLTAWTLLDLFLLLVFTLAVFKLWGFRAALLAFFAFGISFHEPGAPRYLWLILLVPLALERVVPAGWGRRVLGIGKWLALGAFVLALVPFIVGQVQQALYPQLENVDRIFAMGIPEESSPSEPVAEITPQEKMQAKLQRIVIPRLEFRDSSVADAIKYLHEKSVELDTDSPMSERGVEIVNNLSGPNIPGLPNSQESRLTVALTNIPLIEALKYVTSLTGAKFKVEDNAVVIVPASTNTDTLITKEYYVRPGLVSDGSSEGKAGNNATFAGKQGAKDWLISNGVEFGPGASAIYIPSTGKLIVRDTQEHLDLVESIIASDRDASSSKSSRSWKSSAQNLNYDTKVRIQTGPGVPEWTWRKVSFGWSGPVTAAQQVRPILISLTLERVLTALRVALLLTLAAVLLGARKLSGSIFRASGKAAMLLTFFAFLSSASAQSSIPDQATLEKLRDRLLKASDAYPNAAEIPSVTLTLTERKLVIDAEIHAAIRTAVPLPGLMPTWSPLTVLVDGKPEVALRREDGYLWLVLEPGVHRVRAEGSLAHVTEWQWTFVLSPRQVKIDAPGWTVTGVRPDGVPEPQVFFALKQKAVAGAAGYDRQDLASLASIDRHLELGLIWQVQTTVRRLSPLGQAVALRVPLLPGESVVSANAIVKDGFIEVRLGAQDSVFAWESSLAAVNDFKLATRPEDSWVEHWYLTASPVWNVEISGLAPIFEAGKSELIPVWQPWPGESVDLTINRPVAVPGATMTVSRGTHEISLRQRQRVSKLDLSLRCSLGEDFLVELPADAEITSLIHQGQSIPVRKDGNKLIIPVRPGEQNVGIGWKTNVALGLHAQGNEVRLPVESANIQTVINVSENRWVLWAAGPQRGPAVRFWGILICSLLAAVVLGKIARSPLRTIEWMLLAIGLTQVPLPAALVVVGWLFFLAWRGTPGFQQLGRGNYNLLQVALILLTVAALGILITAVGEGLLGNPEMFITGNDSTRTVLRWFQARSETLLPRPDCFSISIWWYRFLMLAWALWLAAALLRWLRRGWEDFSTGGCFRAQPKATPLPPPLPKPTA